ncbi:uncharacterized protein BO80DRAFT_479758 [Aspergillus ibericus CBS 121593]|uniref:Uncharacterized protein n=1 Tax=Aspergillus ibericus CBS 121593 TaxID=1448316 RepID=A0A395GSG2_9EURO|nr:hypothetical protein BO80DRAFT_479758 [Aspergillus ibericus CBS 121593]RAK98520.1 hypothetical protein BO80DRAFT_479758 [Aspergillus ibericus CBS 121593]
MATKGRQDIALLCLAYRESLDIDYEPLISEMSRKCNLVRLPSTGIALRYLANHTPKSIVVTDEGISDPANQGVVKKLKAYIQNGGWVIFALDFARSTTADQFNKLFSQGFGTPWEYGGRSQITCGFNQQCAIPIGRVPVSASSYNLEAHLVKNAAPVEQIVVPMESVESCPAVVAGKQLGKGYLIYCGNDSVEVDLDMVILSVCNWQWLS